MSSGRFSTKLELGFLGEIDVIVNYWYQPEEDDTNTPESVEIEEVKIALMTTRNNEPPVELYVSIDVGWIDATELEEMALEHGIRQAELDTAWGAREALA